MVHRLVAAGDPLDAPAPCLEQRDMRLGRAAPAQHALLGVLALVMGHREELAPARPEDERLVRAHLATGSG